MLIEIDKYAGFCFGVTNAINIAEDLLSKSSEFFSLGHIVHNQQEEDRLKHLGMKIILDNNEIEKVKNKTILIRAHGEPPETYLKAKNNNVKIIDATCPVVLNLQNKIKSAYEQNPESDIVIFGKKGHPEVNGLTGQINNNAKVIATINDLYTLDFKNTVLLFSQTTSDFDEYQKLIVELKNILKKKYGENHTLIINQTICPSVKSRIPRIKEFCSKYDIIIFVSDPISSNGKMLFKICKHEKKEKAYFITSENDINAEWFRSVKSVGITGATSTPLWLMEQIKSMISKIVNN